MFITAHKIARYFVFIGPDCCTPNSNIQFLRCVPDALTKLRKATAGFVTSVCPSVHMRKKTRLPVSGFLRNSILDFFLKPVEKIEVSLKSDKNNGYFT